MKEKEKEDRVISEAIMTPGTTEEIPERSSEKTPKGSHQVQVTLPAVPHQAVLHQAVPAKSLLTTSAIKKADNLKKTIDKK
jgi:hypothetical protein